MCQKSAGNPLDDLLPTNLSFSDDQIFSRRWRWGASPAHGKLWIVDERQSCYPSVASSDHFQNHDCGRDRRAELGAHTKFVSENNSIQTRAKSVRFGFATKVRNKYCR